VKIGSGKTPEGGGDAYVTDGVVFIRSQNVHFDGLRLDDVVFIDRPTDASMASTRVCPNDVLLNITGASLGRVALAPANLGEANVNQHVCIIRPSPDVLPKYLLWCFQSHPFQDRIAELQVGGNRDGLNFEQVGAFTIPRVSLVGQSAIADYLDREIVRIDSLIAGRQRMVELLDERWQSVMHDAAAGRLKLNVAARRSTSVPWLTDLPSHWREGQLKLVARLGTGHTPSRSHPEWWVDLTVPWITTGEVAQMRSDRLEYITDTREQISELGIANSSATLHPAGTVVLCRTASAGYSAIMARDMTTSQDFATWTCGRHLQPRFLLLCLRAMRQDLLGRLAMGSTHKTIYMPDIESIKVPLPPLDEQDALVAAAYRERRALDECASRLGAQIDLLQERRIALITAAVTGQLDVQEAA
jgi:type I restriction enzyme S subunit